MMDSTLNLDRLSRAAEDGNEAVVKLLLDASNIKVDLHDKIGWTPLLRAARNGHEATVKTLLTAHANVDARTANQSTPLHVAAAGGHIETIQALLAAQASVNTRRGDLSTPLHVAAAGGHAKAVKLLLETGRALVDLKDRYGQTPLSKAARNGHEAVVKLLLQTGKVQVDTKDKYHQTPLSKAARHGREAIIKLLLETGKVEVDTKDIYSETPLLKAAQHGHEAVVKLLLETSQVEVNWEDKDGRTSLSWAAQKGHEAVVKLLLETSQVEVNWEDKDGRTPLLWAAQSKHETLVSLLLKTGNTKVDSTNEDDQTSKSSASARWPRTGLPKALKNFEPRLEAFAKPSSSIPGIIHQIYLHVLRLLRPKPDVGYRRLEWQCNCGMPLYGDFRGNNEEIDKLVTEIQTHGFVVTQSGYGAKRSPEGSEQNIPSSSPPVVLPRSAVHLPTRISFIDASQEIVADTSIPRASSINVAGSPSIPMNSGPKFVALCVDNGPSRTVYQEVDISSIPRDTQIFHSFQMAYEACRSSRVNFINRIFAQPVDIKYIQFAVEGLKHVYPIASSPDCTICAQMENRDDLVATRRYERHPVPSSGFTHPPIPSSLFFHLWECPRGITPAVQAMWLERLPKKVGEKLEKACLRTRPDGEPIYGWGILVIEGIQKQRISRLTAAIAALAFVISVAYSVGKNDVSSGFAIGALVIACWAVFITAIYFELQGNR